MAGVLRFMGGIGLALATAGCVSVRPQDPAVVLPPLQPAVQASSVGPMLSPAQAAQNFAAVVARVEPVAEAICHERARGAPCDLQIVIDDRIDQPPNAYQTLDKFGQPIVAFTVALIADARNADELAFVMGHEASHHIAGHIPRQQENGMRGALLAGILASVSGADAATAQQLQSIGATVSARSYSKGYELEADALGAEIALRAGYDPVLGAGFFNRLPDPGDEFLGSHPPNAERQAQVRAVVAALR